MAKAKGFVDCRRYACLLACLSLPDELDRALAYSIIDIIPIISFFWGYCVTISTFSGIFLPISTK
jgi:hypothetical protein